MTKYASLTRRHIVASTAASTATPLVFASSPPAVAAAISDADSVRVAEKVPAARQSGDDRPIRPFSFRASRAKLDELRSRIAATQWPEKEVRAGFRSLRTPRS